MGEFFIEIVPESDEQIYETYHIPTDGKDSRKEEVERVKTIREQVKQICQNVAELIAAGHPEKPQFNTATFAELQNNIELLKETLLGAVDHARAGSLIRTIHMLNMIFKEFERYEPRYLGDEPDIFRNVTQKIAEVAHDKASDKLHNKEGYSQMLEKLNNRAYEALEDKFYLEAMVELLTKENQDYYEEIIKTRCDNCQKGDCMWCDYQAPRDSAYARVAALKDIKAYMERVKSGQESNLDIAESIKRVKDAEFERVANKILLPQDGQPCRYALAGTGKRQLLNTSEKYIRQRIEDNVLDPYYHDASLAKNKQAYKLALDRMMRFDFGLCDYDKIIKTDTDYIICDMIQDQYNFFGGRQIGQKKEENSKDDD